VLAAWMKLPCQAEASTIDLKHALAELGFSELPGGHYTSEDAAVAHILLESIEERLPSFAVSSITADGEATLSFARKYRDPDGKPLRKTSLLPRPLFGIDWALTAPGYSWPVLYHLIWVPGYERYVVTASADCPDMFGYSDFALGSFEIGRPIIDAVGEIIRRDCAAQHDDHGQGRWQLFLGGGLE
jgi:hypothetical protein